MMPSGASTYTKFGADISLKSVYNHEYMDPILDIVIFSLGNSIQSNPTRLWSLSKLSAVLPDTDITQSGSIVADPPRYLGT